MSLGLLDHISCDVTKYQLYTDVIQFKTWLHQKIVKSNTKPTVVDTSKQVNCKIFELDENVKTCRIENQNINLEGFTIASKLNREVNGFRVLDNKNVKFLVVNIAEKLPNRMFYVVANCTVTSVNGKHFRNLHVLEFLILRKNEIETIATDSFKDLVKLSLLELTSNKIKTVDSELLGSSPNLQRLLLNDNKIEDLNGNVFDKLPNFREINLSNNFLTSIQMNLFQNNLRIEKVDFTGNLICTTHHTIDVQSSSKFKKCQFRCRHVSKSFSQFGGTFCYAKSCRAYLCIKIYN